MASTMLFLKYLKGKIKIQRFDFALSSYFLAPMSHIFAQETIPADFWDWR